MLEFMLGLAALFPNTVFESVYSIPKTEGKSPPVFFVLFTPRYYAHRQNNTLFSL